MEKSPVMVSLSNLDKTCRICLLEGEDLQSVYNVLIHSEEQTEAANFPEIFKRHCDVEVSSRKAPWEYPLKSILLTLGQSDWWKASASMQALHRPA